MKLITLIALTLMFIGCASEEPKTPPPGAGAENQNNPQLPPSENTNLEANVISQTVLTCSKEGAEDIVYTAKTYQTPKDCDHPEGEDKNCLCEVLSEDSFFDDRKGVYLYATSTPDWCEGSAMDSIENNSGITVYGERGTEFKRAAHDASYTCSRS